MKWVCISFALLWGLGAHFGKGPHDYAVQMATIWFVAYLVIGKLDDVLAALKERP